MISGGTVTVGNAASFGGNLTFAGSGGVLEFETDTMPTAVISGLVPGDFLLFDNATFGPGATVTLTSGSPDVLSATLDGTHYTLHLDSSVELRRVRVRRDPDDECPSPRRLPNGHRHRGGERQLGRGRKARPPGAPSDSDRRSACSARR